MIARMVARLAVRFVRAAMHRRGHFRRHLHRHHGCRFGIGRARRRAGDRRGKSRRRQHCHRQADHQSQNRSNRSHNPIQSPPASNAEGERQFSSAYHTKTTHDPVSLICRKPSRERGGAKAGKSLPLSSMRRIGNGWSEEIATQATAGLRSPRRHRFLRADHLLFCSLVTVIPLSASSASNCTLSPTLTCLSIAGSLTR